MLYAFAYISFIGLVFSIVFMPRMVKLKWAYITAIIFASCAWICVYLLVNRERAVKHRTGMTNGTIIVPETFYLK